MDLAVYYSKKMPSIPKDLVLALGNVNTIISVLFLMPVSCVLLNQNQTDLNLKVSTSHSFNIEKDVIVLMS